MSLTGPPLVGEDGKLNNRLDAKWVGKAHAALHYLETHGANILDAMRIANRNGRYAPPDVDEPAFWKQELNALNEAFEACEIPFDGIVPLLMRQRQETTVPAEPLSPGTIEFYEAYLQLLPERIAAVTPKSNLSKHHELATYHRIIVDIFEHFHPRPIDLGVGATQREQDDIDAIKRRWFDMSVQLKNLTLQLYYRLSEAIAAKICRGDKLP